MISEVFSVMARDAILVHTTAEIPAKSFAKLDSYDDTNHYFVVSKPNADNLPSDRVVVIPELIAANKTGIAYIGGIHVVLMTGGEDIIAGDIVGTDNAQWTAIEGSGFRVISTFPNGTTDLIIRMEGSGSSQLKINPDQFEFIDDVLNIKLDECE